MRILLLGSTGMLGSDCKKVLNENHEVIAPHKKELDIISWDGVIETLDEVSPDVIVNCVGLTDMDVCETDDFAVRKINVEGPRNLAQGSARFQCKLIHISCDHVFDGHKMIPQPYFEDDTPNPLSAYGKSKMESETAVRENSPNYIIVRTGWLYGLNGNNFVKSILKQAGQKKTKSIRVANDQFGSPTWTYRLALQIRKLISHDGRGTYHATAEGNCSRSECAEFMLKKLDLKVSIVPSGLKDLDPSVSEPVNCLLENRLLKKQGINLMLNWKEDMDAFLDECGKALITEVEGRTK
ncbi:MAG: dTDP-4-dehydrorhamnose reductase [Desulfatiglandaceae bacterium]